MDRIIAEGLLMPLLYLISGVGIIIRIIIWVYYRKLEHASCNMGRTKTAFARQLKLKFENCYKLNLDVKNISAFVERYIQNAGIGFVKIQELQKSLRVSGVLIGIISISALFAQYISKESIEIIMKTALTGILCELFLLLVGIVFETVVLQKKISLNLHEYLENVLTCRLKLEYEDDSKPVISDNLRSGYKTGRLQMAATKVKIKKPSKLDLKAQEEERLIRDIIKEYLC